MRECQSITTHHVSLTGMAKSYGPPTPVMAQHETPTPRHNVPLMGSVGAQHATPCAVRRKHGIEDDSSSSFSSITFNR